MHSLAIDSNCETATAVEIKENEIFLSLMNGRRVLAPVWLFPELEGMSAHDFGDVELIEGGLGILIGDKEAITVRRVIGMDSYTQIVDQNASTFSLL